MRSCMARAAGAAGAGLRPEPTGGSAAGSAPQASRGGGCSRIRERCLRRCVAQPVPEAAAVGPQIALGTVTNVEEAVKWISYTYLYVWMRANPLVDDISHKAYQIDPTLRKHREQFVIEVEQKLDKAQMICCEERTGYFSSTDLGRTASHYYIKYNTIEVREEVIEELDALLKNFCELSDPGGVGDSYGKINILLQTYISQGETDSFSLISDSAYVAQNAARIVHALFEIALRKCWPTITGS